MGPQGKRMSPLAGPWFPVVFGIERKEAGLSMSV